jgi:hypothetical protein
VTGGAAALGEAAQVGEEGQGLAAAGGLWLDRSTDTHYEPPAWQPLYLGGQGFLSR